MLLLLLLLLPLLLLLLLLLILLLLLMLLMLLVLLLLLLLLLTAPPLVLLPVSFRPFFGFPCPLVAAAAAAASFKRLRDMHCKKMSNPFSTSPLATAAVAAGTLGPGNPLAAFR